MGQVTEAHDPTQRYLRVKEAEPWQGEEKPEEEKEQCRQAAQQMDGDAAMPPYLKLAPPTLDISSEVAGGLPAKGPAKLVRPSPVTAGEFPVVNLIRPGQADTAHSGFRI